MRAGQVVAQRSGPVLGALEVGTGQQLLDKIPPQPQLCLGQRPQMRELQGQHSGRIFESDLRTVVCGPVRVDEGDDAEHLAARLGH